MLREEEKGRGEVGWTKSWSCLISLICCFSCSSCCCRNNGGDEQIRRHRVERRDSLKKEDIQYAVELFAVITSWLLLDGPTRMGKL